MTLIYIYGHTAQGKTTLAQSIPGYVISTDKAYNYMRYIEGSEASKTYLDTCHHNENKEAFYRVHWVSAREHNTIIIEGSTLASEKEREFIRNIFNPTKEIYLHLQHQDHAERHQKKHGKPPHPFYEKWYRSIYDKPEGEILLTNDKQIELWTNTLKLD